MEIYVHFFLLYFSSVFNQAYSEPTLIYTNSIYAYVHKKIINMYYISSTHFDIHIEEWKKRFPHNDSTISLKMALHFELLDAYASSFLNSYAPSSHQTKLYFAVLYLNLQKFGQTFQGSLQLFLLKFKISTAICHLSVVRGDHTFLLACKTTIALLIKWVFWNRFPVVQEICAHVEHRINQINLSQEHTFLSIYNFTALQYRTVHAQSALWTILALKMKNYS